MFGLNLINPSIAVNLLKKQVEKQLNKKIEKFDIVYKSKEDDLYFNIEGTRYVFDSEKIKTAIAYQVNENLEKGQELDYVILKVNGKQITAYIYYSENEQKLFIEHKLN